MREVSVVVPVCNEEGNVALLHREICEVCRSSGYRYEIIFVDDGSSDRTAEILRELRPLKLIRLRRNFGQTSAMDAGIKAARYDYIVTMDGDRQNDPADIPRMIDYLEEQHLDVVSGWRKNRKDPRGKRLASRIANFLRHRIVNDRIHDSGCTLKVYRRECFAGMNLYGEQHRFIPALLKIKGFTVGEIVVNHRPRIAGVTKYGWKRTIRGFVDLISVWFWNKYASRPIHLLGGAGLGFIGLGLICGIWSVVLFVQGKRMSGNLIPLLLTVFFVVLGVLLFVFGLMSEIMMKTYYGVHVDTPYSIKEVIDHSDSDSAEQDNAKTTASRHFSQQSSCE